MRNGETRRDDLLRELRELFAFLLGRAEAPTEPRFATLEFLREQRLTPLFHLKLEGRDHPFAAECAGDFNNAFQRKAKLLEAWREVCTTFNEAGIKHLTLGSLAFAGKLFGHEAAKYSQDVDLLVAPEKGALAQEKVEALGWVQPPSQTYFARDDLQLDLHVTPGEEARYPSLGKTYGLETSLLLEHRTPVASTPAFAPREDHLLDLRVLHFLKHKCEVLIDALEIYLLLEKLELRDELRETLRTSKSGPLWAVVLELLRRWGLEPAFDPTSEEDKAFLKHGRVQQAIEDFSHVEGGRSALRLAMMMMPLGRKLRFVYEVTWPSAETLGRAMGEASPPLHKSTAARLKRVARAIRGAIKGK